MNSKLRISNFEAAICVVAVILFFIVGSTMTVATTNQVDPVIKITNPANEETVSSSIFVNGTFSGETPVDQYAWVVINPRDSTKQFWPQGGNHIKPINQKWSLMAIIGGNQDRGKKFDIIVISVDNETDIDFSNWVNQGDKTGNYPSKEFPENATIMDKITVIRK